MRWVKQFILDKIMVSLIPCENSGNFLNIFS